MRREIIFEIDKIVLCSTNAVALVEEESAECMANGLSDKYSLIYLERLLTCTVLISHLYKNIRW